MVSVKDRLMHGWNAFKDGKFDWARASRGEIGAAYGHRPDRARLLVQNERSIITSIYNRIALDVAQVSIRHVRMNDSGYFAQNMNSGLNNALMLDPNLDQSARAFMTDLVLSMFDRGVVAVVPVETTLDPTLTGGYDIGQMRVGEVVHWHTRHIRVKVWDDRPEDPNDILNSGGRFREVTLAKKDTAIIENPMYSVINEPNSTLQRLLRKLSLLDVVDEQASSGKLDIMIQLPYVVKSETRKQQAEQRRKSIEDQLTGSKYGIAYIDGTEKITQLNRPAENNLLKQVEYLHTLLYSQLGLTEGVFNGTADEKEMLNYYNRTVEPILAAIAQEFKRKFLTKTARTQGQSIEYFRDPFRLMTAEDLANIADKFTRNEVLSSNEVRGIIGLPPSSDPKADELRNKNLPLPEEVPPDQQ